MRRILLTALLAALAVSAAIPARPAEDALALWRENQRLKAEAALAATPKAYFELDLERRRVQLKARGMVLLEVPVQEHGLWGRRPAIGPTSMQRRDALARPAVHTGEDKAPGALDDQLLELTDMPSAYRLGLAGDVDIDVFPRETGRWPRLRQRVGVWRWWLTRPLVTLRDRRKHRESTSIFLVLDPEDARRLYWSLFEGLDGILIPP